MRLVLFLSAVAASSLFASLAAAAPSTIRTGPALLVRPVLTIKSAAAVPPSQAPRTSQLCNGSEVVFIIRVDVANTGAGDSLPNNDPRAVLASDVALADWTAGHALPSIQHGTDTIVPIAVAAYRDGPKMISAHTFKVVLGSSSTTVSYTVPDGFCGLHAPKGTSLTTTTAKLPQNMTVSQALSKVLVNRPSTTFVKAPPVVPTIAAPTGFGPTFDVKVCTRHMGLAGAFICPTLVTTQNQTPLVWDWTPCSSAGCQQTINGFRLYVVSTVVSGSSRGAMQFQLHTIAQTRTIVSTQSDPTLTILAVQNFSSLIYPSKCIVVTAFAGQNESADSNPLCGGSSLATIGGTPQSMIIGPTNISHSWTRVSIDEQYCAEGTFGYSGVDRGTYGGVVGGYDLMRGQPAQCNNDLGSAAAYYARTAFVFDLSPLVGKSIISATLNTGYRHETNYYYTGQPRPLCDQQLTLGFATTNWQAGFDPSQPIPMADAYDIGYSVSYIDFTSQVRHWLTNLPNYGMVVRGPLEGNPADYQSWQQGVCLYADVGVQLIVTYT